MSHPLHDRSFLRELDFTAEEWSSLLRLVAQLKADKKAGREVKRLTDKSIALIFEKTSTHTRCSFEVAVYDQGAQVTYLDSSGSQMGHKESVADTARVLGRFYDDIGSRGEKQEHVEAPAELSGVSAWNGLTDEWHPTRMLADQLTMLGYSDKPIEQISFVYLGNMRSNVANSLLTSMALMEMDVRTVALRELRTSPEVVVQAEKLTKDNGARILTTDNTARGVKGVDFLYTDMRVSIGEPKGVWDQRIVLLTPYQVNARLVKTTGNPNVEFLHCPSAFHDRNTTVGEGIFAKTRVEGLEVTDNVFETERNVAFGQAENRMCTTKAVMVATLGKRDWAVGIIIAFGRNALSHWREKPDASAQICNVEVTAHELTKLAGKHGLVLIHGNGLQVDALVLRSASDKHLSEPCPFNILGAQTQGMTGYWLLQAMQGILPGYHVAAMVSQTLVMAGDPAFPNPTKFIGEVYTKEEVEKPAEERGWMVKPDGEHYRRTVGSPMPQRVIETRLVRILLDTGTIVACPGGDGVPVVRNEEGKLKDIEAVIDKDLTASVMAEALEADALLILTDVDGVFRDLGTENQKQASRAAPVELWSMGFPSGSMGPKAGTMCRFVELTGDMATIGRLEDAVSIIEGHAEAIVALGGNYGGSDDTHPPIPEQLSTRIRGA